jgi:hypothetical protein
MLPGQGDLFLTLPSTSLVGLRMLMGGRCPECRSNSAVLGSSAGPHHARICCTDCGRFHSWLGGECAEFLKTFIDIFGRPQHPLSVRRSTMAGIILRMDEKEFE